MARLPMTDGHRLGFRPDPSQQADTLVGLRWQWDCETCGMHSAFSADIQAVYRSARAHLLQKSRA